MYRNKKYDCAKENHGLKNILNDFLGYMSYIFHTAFNI